VAAKKIAAAAEIDSGVARSMQDLALIPYQMIGGNDGMLRPRATCYIGRRKSPWPVAYKGIVYVGVLHRTIHVLHLTSLSCMLLLFACLKDMKLSCVSSLL
jgi:hypothetical protein